MCTFSNPLHVFPIVYSVCIYIYISQICKWRRNASGNNVGVVMKSAQRPGLSMEALESDTGSITLPFEIIMEKKNTM